MSYRTLEVELEDGRLRPRGAESLPAKARALLTILEPPLGETNPARPPGAGLRRFLSGADFDLMDQQFKASMEADFWDH